MICSRARKSGLDVPCENERSAHNEVIVTLSASQIDQIKNMTDLSPQEFVNLSVDQIVSTSFLNPPYSSKSLEMAGVLLKAV